MIKIMQNKATNILSTCCFLVQDLIGVQKHQLKETCLSIAGFIHSIKRHFKGDNFNSSVSL